MTNARNVDWYVELFEKYHFRPYPGEFVRGKGACALGIACVEYGIDTQQEPVEVLTLLSQKLDVDENFLSGIIWGFDNGVMTEETLLSSDWGAEWSSSLERETWREGALIGKRVRNAVNPRTIARSDA